MRASTILSAIALVGTASAMPSPDTDDYWSHDERAIIPRNAFDAPADATAPWVKVNDEGQPVQTHTPSLTTDENGATAVADGAPHDLTATVFTITSNAKITTSTGNPPNPTPTHKGGEGAFSRCYNMDGEYAPFCRPSTDAMLYTGSTYYVTWDPDYYNTTSPSANATYEVALRVEYLNKTSNEWLSLQTYDRVPAEWGFWPFKVENKHLKGSHSYNNITLTLLSSLQGSNAKNSSVALPAAVTKPTQSPGQGTPVPDHQDLIIALPVTFGTLALILFGVCMWNRKTRRIQLRDVMSRARRKTGYTGRSARRMWRKDNGIQLSSRMEPPTPDYTDDLPLPDRPRRDSDELGSLAGSPINSTFHGQNTTGGKNTFRDEMARQRVERQREDQFF